MNINANASSTFYIGYKIDNIRYVKDKNGTLVYSDFKTIHKSGTNELAYCIQPGVKMSDDAYDEYEQYNDKFFIDEAKMQKVRLIARYGYLYKNHTDINWYVASQFMIWHAVMPTTWDIYFVDSNNNRIDLFKEEIDEINNLISQHHDSPNIDSTYEFNYLDDIVIEDDNYIIENYKFSSGSILGNKLVIGDVLEPGDYSYHLNIIDNTKPLFYNHPVGQDLFTRGEVYTSSVEFTIHITAGKVKINECDEKTFKEVMIGGTYEILDQDDFVVDTITCLEGEECLSKILPIGYYKIRVKDLGDDYEINDTIYDVEVTDNGVSEIPLCSLKKDKPINIVNINNTNIVTNNNISNIYNLSIFNNDSNYDVTNQYTACDYNSDYKISDENGKGFIKNAETVFDENKNFKNIDIPNTSKSTSTVVIFLFVIMLYYLSFIKHEKSI